MPEIGSNYGVIVNKVSKPVLERLEGKKNDFINTMFAGIPENQRCVYTSVSFFEKSTYLEDRENLWLNPEEFKDDQGKPLLQFVYETGMVTSLTQHQPDINSSHHQHLVVKTDFWLYIYFASSSCHGQNKFSLAFNIILQ